MKSALSVSEGDAYNTNTQRKGQREISRWLSWLGSKVANASIGVYSSKAAAKEGIEKILAPVLVEEVDDLLWEGGRVLGEALAHMRHEHHQLR